MNEQLTDQEVAYLTAYDNTQVELKSIRQHPEWYSSDHVFQVFKISLSFNMAKVIDLQNRLIWYGK